jgi:hypothetical protein
MIKTDGGIGEQRYSFNVFFLHRHHHPVNPLRNFLPPSGFPYCWMILKEKKS